MLVFAFTAACERPKCDLVKGHGHRIHVDLFEKAVPFVPLCPSTHTMLIIHPAETDSKNIRTMVLHCDILGESYGCMSIAITHGHLLRNLTFWRSPFLRRDMKLG